MAKRSASALSSARKAPKTPTRSPVGTRARRKSVAAAPPPPKPASSEEDDADFDDGEDDDGTTDSSENEDVGRVASAAEQDAGDDDGDDESGGSDSEVEMVGESGGFTDDNAAWLKPKKKAQLLGDSDSDDGALDDEFDGVDSDEDDEEELSMERKSRVLDREMAQIEAEGREELAATIASHTSTYELPTEDELRAEREGRVMVAPSELTSRLDAVLGVLADFRARRQPGRSRSDYIERLRDDLAELHGILPELVDAFLSLFSPAECREFLAAGDAARPVVLRTNTLRARRKDLARALMKRGVRLDPLAPWSKVGIKVYESPVPVGATPEYLAGHYMLQAASSLCPVMALAPLPHESVLDLSAAPGGKTSYLAQLMRNTGSVTANDLSAERQKATVANLHRLGVRNAVVCAGDGRRFAQTPNRYDRVLLDAPCSGLGVISRDQSVKVRRTMADVRRTAHLQKQLLLAGIDALNHRSKTGGYIVYSTCSVSAEENEEVVQYALGKRDIKLVDPGLDFGKPGMTKYQHKRFHPSLSLTRRFYPHVHNMDGFYVAKIQKMGDGQDKDAKKKGTTDKEAAQADDTMEVDEEKTEVDDDDKMEVDGEEDQTAAPPAPANKGPASGKGGKQKKDGATPPPPRKKHGKARVPGLGKNKKKGAATPPPDPPGKPAGSKAPSVPPKKKARTNAKVTKPRRK
eukprot:CAMPEP_0194334396 /NCGR_PEP_ID=MMETSP0171-20130528/65985_1 /TAXON_ID=218684 /ORGANISM="Corethron pennatum, Strain L29A3" /LENGTH=691 /DNA_ID=CAMNT_0039097025 /DNA_START=59 /DNA_END=2134 /DNA_ORIENTATION=-